MHAGSGMRGARGVWLRGTRVSARRGKHSTRPLTGPGRGCLQGLWGQPLVRCGDRPGLTRVGDTRIEPVTSTVSRCRVTALMIESPLLAWRLTMGGLLGSPVLSLVFLVSVGTSWGQQWGHDLGAAAEENREPVVPAPMAATAVSSCSRNPSRLRLLTEHRGYGTRAPRER
jgi:hypothetical protein